MLHAVDIARITPIAERMALWSKKGTRENSIYLILNSQSYIFKSAFICPACHSIQLWKQLKEKRIRGKRTYAGQLCLIIYFDFANNIEKLFYHALV